MKHPIHALFSVFLSAAALVSSLHAQIGCANSIDPSNWANTYVGGTEARTAVLFINTLSIPIEACFIQHYHEDNTLFSGAEGRVVIHRDSPTGTRVGATAWAAIPSSPGLVTMPNPGATVLQPGQRYFLVRESRATGFTPIQVRVTAPFGSSGPVSQVWHYDEYQRQWFQRQDRSYLYNVGFRPFGNAKTRLFGASCGTIEPCGATPFRSINWSNGPLLGRLATSGVWAFRVSDPGSQFGRRDVCAIDLRMNTTEATDQRLRLRIFDNSTSRTAPGRELMETTVRVRPGPASVHHIPLPTPLHVAGTEYWIVMDVTFPLVLPIERYGGGEWEAVDTGAGWATANNDSWSVRTYVTTTPRQFAPQLNMIAPRFGRASRTSLSNAAANAPGALFFGSQSLNLPLDLIGATGCHLYVDPLVSIPLMTNSSGQATRNLSIPNDQAWLGRSYFVQFAVINPGVNALGVTFSNGGEGIVGN